ncbi:hypothetical protein CEUSTIGMA_g8149.t1 [Chlamydomonas eustigma]|uniref:Essential protein Yae1 N-terminal domain-containing protein n=1 Tax=Chlamydomonas eustigma TaxID=1157962 RepID=A0A250XCA7_9CHLO|nr:hypothetical protein CEUSTIGMA_g8149.t1 [Chlamydomonas eustigma]|eukprot:GAX80714.1 hypothetical protein CEUSTIGMA_g8149.t1 [Chlamydomonas eustigma]
MCATYSGQTDSNDEDVWGDEEDEHEELAREARTRQHTFHHAGYREAIEEGKRATLQSGFNIGFREGVQAGLDWGQLDGMIQTLDIFCGQVAGTSGLRQEVNEMAKQFKDIPRRQAMLAAFKNILSAPPEECISQPSDSSICNLPKTAHGAPGFSAESSMTMQQGSSSAVITPSVNDDNIYNEDKYKNELDLGTDDEMREALRRLPAYMLETASEAVKDHEAIVLPDILSLIERLNANIQSLSL